MSLGICQPSTLVDATELTLVSLLWNTLRIGFPDLDTIAMNPLLVRPEQGYLCELEATVLTDTQLVLPLIMSLEIALLG